MFQRIMRKVIGGKKKSVSRGMDSEHLNLIEDV